jgi:hypothetical protein
MDSSEVLDQIAQLGLFGKKYKDFASAPADAQKVIRMLSERVSDLPAPEPKTVVLRKIPAAAESGAAARLTKLEATVARLEKGLSRIVEGLERLERLDVIASAASFKMDHSLKTRAGIERARRRGTVVGRRRREFSMDEALKLRAAGKTVRAIGDALGVSFSTVATALRAAKSSKKA